MRILVLLSLVGACLVGWSGAPAGASPLCYGASTYGTVTGSHAEGTCVPYSYGTICQYEGFGLDPSADFNVEACVPAAVTSDPLS